MRLDQARARQELAANSALGATKLEEDCAFINAKAQSLVAAYEDLQRRFPDHMLGLQKRMAAGTGLPNFQPGTDPQSAVVPQAVNPHLGALQCVLDPQLNPEVPAGLPDDAQLGAG